VTDDNKHQCFTTRSDLVIESAWDEILAIHARKAIVVVIVLPSERTEDGETVTPVEFRSADEHGIELLVQRDPAVEPHMHAPYDPSIVRIVYGEAATGDLRFVALPLAGPIDEA